MKAKNVKIAGKVFGGFVGAILAIIILAVTCGFSWIITCGIIKLITMCFGWTFNWAWATGIWLVMFLLKSVFSHTTTVKK
jgi:hypothetical protein